MENCEEYQYKNSLNIFSLTLGPFEKEAEKKRAIAVGGEDNIDALDQNNENDETQADEEDDDRAKNEEEVPLVKKEDP